MDIVTSVASDDDTGSEGGVSRLNYKYGAAATLLDEPKVSLLIDDNWALAKEEEINYRVVDEAVDNDDCSNDDDDIKHQPLKSTNNGA